MTKALKKYNVWSDKNAYFAMRYAHRYIPTKRNEKKKIAFNPTISFESGSCTECGDSSPCYECGN